VRISKKKKYIPSELPKIPILPPKKHFGLLRVKQNLTMYFLKFFLKSSFSIKKIDFENK